MKRSPFGSAAIIGSLAGLVGGLAEVIWIGIYAALTNTDAGLVARGVTDAIGITSQTASPVIGGIGIHMGLAAILGVALALALRPIAGLLRGMGLYAAVIAALSVVWAINFFVVLPLISPQFVHIVPYGVSLLSKLLFGVAAACFFQLARSATPRVITT